MELNKYIDQTNLDMKATKEDIRKLCDEAIKYNFRAICINPYYVELAASLLKETSIEIAAVVGYPLGMNLSSVKEYEAISAIEAGATEIDMVINVGALKDKEYDFIKQEIETIRDAIEGHALKVIIETCYLTTEEIIKMTNICNDCFVNFIKTSTGHYGSAKVSDVELMKTYCNEILEVKASGGISNVEQIEAMIEAGATCIGTSHGVDIMIEEMRK